MTYWEYTTCDVDQDSGQGDERLQRAGAEGWEAYAITRREHYVDRHTTDTVLVHHLKRPMPPSGTSQKGKTP